MTRRSIRSLLLLGLAGAAVVSGCGGGDDDDGKAETSANTVPTTTPAPAPPPADPAAQATAATNCLRGKHATIKPQSPYRGTYALVATVYAGPNPVATEIAMAFAPSPTKARIESKAIARAGGTPSLQGNSVLAYFDPPTPVNQRFVQNCFDKAVGSS
jgi:hypothetical protein